MWDQGEEAEVDIEINWMYKVDISQKESKVALEEQQVGYVDVKKTQVEVEEQNNECRR